MKQLRNIVEGYSALVRSLNDELMVELMRKVKHCSYEDIVGFPIPLATGLTFKSVGEPD